MKTSSLIIILLFASCLSYASNKFKLNDTEIDKMFNQATEISFLNNFQGLAEQFKIKSQGVSTEINNKIILALILQFIPVLDFFGVHRYVLGTKSNMWASYAFTCGGIFGFVPIVDWWVLLINGLIEEKGDQYLNKDTFFLWAN